MGNNKTGFFGKLVKGLAKTRSSIAHGFDSIFSGFSSIDEDFYEELEEILIMSDIGIKTTSSILDNLRAKVKENKIKDPSECKELLINTMKEQMTVKETDYDFENKKSIILVMGVNGVSKTTTVGKLASQLRNWEKVIVAVARIPLEIADY